MRQMLTVAAACLAVCLSAGRVAAEPTTAEEAAFQAAVGRVAAAVVRIEPLALTARGDGGVEAAPGSGPATGTVVGPGLVLATAFAIPDDVADAVIVLPDGGRRAARVKARDRSRGLVLLSVERLPDTPPLEPVPRADLRPGQWAIAVGRGWSATTPSVAVGIVSATNRAWGRGVQTDAAVSPMNYGGPLVDIAGRVIGILAPLPADTAGMTEGTELYDAGIGFAVPLEDILAVLPRLAAGDSLDAGIIGIAYRSQDVINGPPVIASVRQGSPAARAGLLPGDRIVAIDGRPVRRIADARHAIAPKYAADTVVVTVERSGGDANKPERVELRAELVATLPPWRRAVIGCVVATDDEEDERGEVRVDWVLPDGPAAQAGLLAGDVIESIAGGDAAATPLDGRGSLAGVLAGIEPGDRVKLSVRRDGAVTTIAIVTDEIPEQVPAEGPLAGPLAEPLAGPLADPLAGPPEEVEVVRLAAAEVADPPLAVIPRGKGPVGLLVWLGGPHGKVADAEATVWKAAAVRHGVAVILPGSADPAAWSRDDLPGVTRAIASLHARRPVDAARIGIAGSDGGGAFAWIVAKRLGSAAGGVALVGGSLPRTAQIEPSEPGGSPWVLLGPGADDLTRERVATDRERLAKAGYAAGLLPDGNAVGPPAETLCRWVSLLGLL